MTLWSAAHQAPLSMGFSIQEYWSGLPFPSLGDLPNPGIEPKSLKSPVLAGGFFTISTTWETPQTHNLLCVEEMEHPYCLSQLIRALCMGVETKSPTNTTQSWLQMSPFLGHTGGLYHAHIKWEFKSLTPAEIVGRCSNRCRRHPSTSGERSSVKTLYSLKAQGPCTPAHMGLCP